jgi:dolichol kinase
MNKINHLELRRKIAHIMIGIISILLIIYNLVTPFIIFIILIAGVFVSLLSLSIKIPIISWFLDKFERDKDKNELPGRGIIFAVVGSLLALQLFERNIALASMIILIFADPISHLVGKVFGKTKSPINKEKNIEGPIVGAIVSSALAMFFVHPILAISGSVIAMLFESLVIEIQKIQLDDNLVIPLAAGTTMFLITEFLII